MRPARGPLILVSTSPHIGLILPAAGGAAQQMQHIESMWKMRVAALLAVGLACVPTIGHAESDSVMRAERTSAFDVVLTIGPAQAMSPASMQSSQSTDMSMSHGMSMGETDAMMQPQPADQGMPVNHWIDVRVTQAGSGAVVSDVTPTIRVVDKSTGEARDLPGIMGMAGGMNAADFHYGQNVFLPEGTYQITVLLGPADTALYRDVTVANSVMLAEPAMNGATGSGHDMSMNDMPGTHP